MEFENEKRNKIEITIMNRFPMCEIEQLSFDGKHFCVNALLHDNLSRKHFYVKVCADTFEKLCEKIAENDLSDL